MLKFPAGRVYRRKRIGLGRSLLIALLLIVMVATSWLYAVWTDERQPVPVAGQPIYVIDGDSFTVGNRQLRLDGIDAPELHQMCADVAGTEWPCGRSARAALETLLLAPGLSCVAEVQDRYARSVANCRSSSLPDIAAAQVQAGMAVSHEFNGMRDYGGEEDSARTQKRGIWQGAFIRPDAWRAQHPRALPSP
jgi:endonuclease YncB( thermonuclease family)